MFAHLGVIGNLGIIEATMKIPKDAKAQIEQILGRFIRQIPSKPEYQTRLVEELEIIIKLRFTEYFITICDVLKLTEDITHMTRGSAGSSLVCYLLGITDVDPIKWKIPLARFLNPLRDDLPDVDIDSIISGFSDLHFSIMDFSNSAIFFCSTSSRYPLTPQKTDITC